MIHYHGLPITSESAKAAVAVLTGGHGFLSFSNTTQAGLCIELCQSFAVDNGAYSFWKTGKIPDWNSYYSWIESIKKSPNFDFAVIPDVIDGSPDDNNALLKDWPFGCMIGVPVYHIHEPLGRLERLASDYHKVCLGSSGQYSVVGSVAWKNRMEEVFRVVCDNEGFPLVKLHGLRMLDVSLFCKMPLSSADSTNIARNIGIDSRWKGTYSPSDKAARAFIIKNRIESVNGSSTWCGWGNSNNEQPSLF